MGQSPQVDDAVQRERNAARALVESERTNERTSFKKKAALDRSFVGGQLAFLVEQVVPRKLVGATSSVLRILIESVDALFGSMFSFRNTDSTAVRGALKGMATPGKREMCLCHW